MSTKTLQAWLLHKRAQGDTSVRVTCLARELGVVSCLYRGGRTPRKQAALQPFTLLWLYAKEKQSYYYAERIEPCSKGLSLQGDSLFGALYINELIYLLLKEGDPHPELYDAYSTTLEALSNAVARRQVEQVLRRFECGLLKACGYELITNHDVEGNSIDPQRTYHYLPGEGFVVAPGGISGDILQALTTDDLDCPGRLSELKRITRRAIDHAVGGKEIKSRALYGAARPPKVGVT